MSTTLSTLTQHFTASMSLINTQNTIALGGGLVALGAVLAILRKRSRPKRPRYITNTCPDYSGGSVEIPRGELRTQLFDLLTQIKSEYDLDEPQYDFAHITVYGGKLGIAFMFLELYDMWPKEEEEQREQFLQDCEAFLKAAERDLQNSPGAKNLSDSVLSLMISFHGLNFVSAIFWDRKGDLEKRNHYLDEYLKNATNDQLMKECSTAVNVGSSNYLQGLYFLRSKLGRDVIPEDKMEYMMKVIIDIGLSAPDSLKKAHNNAPLVFQNLKSWQSDKAIVNAVFGSNPVMKFFTRPISYVFYYMLKDRVFHGMAIGLAGPLYAFLHAPSILKKHPEWENIVKQCSDYLLGLDPNCNAPVHGKKDLMDWCLGAPGVVQFMAEAYNYFGEEKYLEAAKRGSDIMWQQGLLTKGNGICHGVSGIAFVFLDMYRVTKEEKYLHRAVEFAKFTWSSKAKEQQRIPDHKYSLFEGMAGQALLLAGLYIDPKATRFPLMTPPEYV